MIKKSKLLSCHGITGSPAILVREIIEATAFQKIKFIKMTNQADADHHSHHFRDRIGNFITIASIILIAGLMAALCYYTFTGSTNWSERKESMQMLLTAILPLLGTWVGTVLAYYFSRDNFAAANESVRRMVTQISTSDEKLKATKSKDVMMGRQEMKALQLKPDQAMSAITVKYLFEFMDTQHVSRLPILDSSGKLLFMFHRSTLDHFVVYKMKAGATRNLSTS